MQIHTNQPSYMRCSHIPVNRARMAILHISALVEAHEVDRVSGIGQRLAERTAVAIAVARARAPGNGGAER